MRAFLSRLTSEEGLADGTAKFYLARVKQVARYRAGGETPSAWRAVKVRALRV